MQHRTITKNFFGLLLLTILSQQAYADCAITTNPNGTGGQDVLCFAADADGYTGTANGDDISIPVGATVDNGALHTIEALAGNDIITLSGGTVTSGNDAVQGGDGNDLIIVNSGSITASFDGIVGDGSLIAPGDDIIIINGGTITTNQEAIEGNEGNDSITINGGILNAGDNTIEGNEGNDSITINGGTLNADSDVIKGDDGDDTITINAGTLLGDSDGVHGGNGQDIIVVNGGSITGTNNQGVQGGNDNDNITINGGTISGAFGAVRGDAGDDTITLGGDATIVGDIDGGDESDTLRFTMAVPAADIAALQATLDIAAPVGGSIIINGFTYTWFNFEVLEYNFQVISVDVPTLQQWALFLLMGLLGLFGMTYTRRNNRS